MKVFCVLWGCCVRTTYNKLFVNQAACCADSKKIIAHNKNLGDDA